jgi:hypothetical protein
VRRLRELETIHLHVDLILGLPFETYDSFRTSIGDALAMRPHYLQMGLLKMLPDTVLRAQARQWGYRFSATPPYSVFSSQWLSVAQMRELYWLGECIEKFYNNRYFVSVWDYLRESGEDMAAFFAMLAYQMKDRGLLSMATTQRTLSRELRDATASRADSELIAELLRFDWLRCGHRTLPDHLDPTQGSIDAIRRRLMTSLPASLPGAYTHAGRAAWLRTTTFCHFSAPALRELFPTQRQTPPSRHLRRDANRRYTASTRWCCSKMFRQTIEGTVQNGLFAQSLRCPKNFILALSVRAAV